MNNIAGFGRPANPPGGGPPGAGQGEPSCGEKIAQMWAGVPILWRFLFWTSIIVYAVSWIWAGIIYYTFNIPQLVIFKVQLWRIFTAPLSNKDLLMLLFGLLSYLPRGCQVEKLKGTTKFFIYFMWMNAISQILLIGLYFLVNLVFAFPAISLGLWTMVMVDMTVDSLREPDLERNLCCWPIMLKSKYFPYIFLVIFGLLFPEGFLALFSGYLTGVLYSIGRLAFTEPSDNCIAKVNGTVMKPFVNNPAYVSQNASLDNPQPGFSMFQQPFPAPGGSGGGSAAANNQSNAQNNSNQTRTPASQAPKPFAGKGVSVGSNLTGYQGSSNNNANTYSVQQTIREEAKGPNPLTQKSKLVKEHYEKNKQEEQETHSDDEDADEHDDLEKNPDKKNNSDDLLNFSN